MNGQKRSTVLNGKSEPEYMTGQEVATMLQVSVKSVWRWADKDRSMPVLKIGGTVRFPRERLLRWLQRREQGTGRAKQPDNLLRSQPEPLDRQGNSLPGVRRCARL
jgi:excisionase family DNA binding protein